MSGATRLDGSDVDAHLPLTYGGWLEQKRIEREKVLRAEHDRQLSAAITAIYQRYLAERAYDQWRRQHDDNSATSPQQRQDDECDATRRRALCTSAFTEWREHKSRSARAAAVSQREESEERRRQEESQRALSAERSRRAYADWLRRTSAHRLKQKRAESHRRAAEAAERARRSALSAEQWKVSCAKFSALIRSWEHAAAADTAEKCRIKRPPSRAEVAASDGARQAYDNKAKQAKALTAKA